ncbi:MAG: S-adenosylmethionine synthetase [Hyphomonadaceae bacterium]|nr:MAG: S-adenosylmethionine synthetase [Hyphomonadaceae bacterium]
MCPYFGRNCRSFLDPWVTRAACETLATTNRVVIAGETRCEADISEDEIIATTRAAIKDIGYEQDGFHHATAEIEVLLHGQSAHIAQGVDSSGNKEEGAGDQGIMFGYATNETKEYMPAPLLYSHKILQKLAEVRHNGKEAWLGPDAKSQVTVHYVDGRPAEATSIVLSTQHLDANMTSEDIAALVRPYIEGVLGDDLPISANCAWHINPTGTLMAVRPHTGAAHFRAKTQQKLTVLPLMLRAIWPKMWLLRALRIVAPSNCPTRLALPSHCQFMPIVTALKNATWTRWKSALAKLCASLRAVSAPT